MMEDVEAAIEGCFSSLLGVSLNTPASLSVEVDRVLGGHLGHVFDRPLSSMTHDEVQAEKSLVKRKLRAYDAYFQQRHGHKVCVCSEESILPYLPHGCTV